MRRFPALLLSLIAAATATAQGVRPLADRFGQPHSTTVRGIATNPDGKPVAEAKVFLLSTNRTRPGNFDPLLAETTTDEQGTYVFQNVSVPILPPPPGPVKKSAEGALQVFGSASGYGFTWHPEQIVRPEKRPATAAAEKQVFYDGEDCVADLRFEPPASIRGRITDENEQPLTGVSVNLGAVKETGSLGTCSYLGPPDAVGESPRDSFSGMDRLPQETAAVTNADGRYLINGLRRETSYYARIDYRPECEPLSVSVATTSSDKGRVDRRLGYDGSLDHSFVLPRSINIRLTAADTNRPLAGVVVRGHRERTLRGGTVATSDAAGNAMLLLLPDSYTLVAEPSYSAPYISGESKIKVAKQPATQTAEISLQPAATLVIQASDSDTGKPLGAVSFLQESDAGKDRDELHSQTVFADYPTTNDSGELRAVMRPGPRRIVVNQYPRDYEPVSTASPMMDLKAGETHPVRFELRKKASAARTPDDELTPLRALITKHRELSNAGTYQIRAGVLSAFVGAGDLTAADIRSLVEGRDFATAPDFFEELAKRFPKLGFHPRQLTIVADRQRVRNESTYQVSGSEPQSQTSIFNGRENITVMLVNRQVSLTPGIVGTTPQRSAQGPEVLSRPSAINLRPPQKVAREGGKYTLTWESPTSHARELLDENTGFLYYAFDSYGNAGNTRETWQFAPRRLENGRVLATLSVNLDAVGNKVNLVRAYQLVEADLKPPPPDAFVVSAAAGTNIVDSRSPGQSAKTKVTPTAIADVVAFANRIADDQRSILPVLKIGQPTPKLQARLWLNASGKTAEPELAGKIVLIDFWGTWCGPCIAELPEVQALAKEFRDKQDFLLIGLHESSGELDGVAELARKHGLTYQLAIDRADAESHGFGAMHKAFGIRGIPNCVVLDRQARIAYIGRFEQAAITAAKLLDQAATK